MDIDFLIGTIQELKEKIRELEIEKRLNADSVRKLLDLGFEPVLKNRETKYWFVVIRHGKDRDIRLLLGERCDPKLYEIHDEKIWWFPQLRYGLHEDELYESYEEALKVVMEEFKKDLKDIRERMKRVKERVVE
ncbi:hypothetical protein J7K24_02865 [bacterium]|nr:hypothetical protein [bacterium]